MQILTVVGARPNFMKAAPLVRCLQESSHEPCLLHTGQHYDANMSKVFFEDLGMPEPDVYLGVGSGTHAEQTATVMVAFEKHIQQNRPDLVVVVGDVNSTLACSLVCAKSWVPVAHLEAGLRSGDRTMPEEINRIVTDSISDLLLTHCADADEHLLREGVAPQKIWRVGNIMIDSLVSNLERAKGSKILQEHGLTEGGYGVLTLHRPANVDDEATLLKIMGAVHELAKDLPIVFSCHPRTAGRLTASTSYTALSKGGDVRHLPPLGYLDFLHLTSNSKIVLTDSGGLQEETTYLGIPCLTIRDNTERPITMVVGTNELVGRDPARILEAGNQILGGEARDARVPDLWDGHTAERVVKVFDGWAAARS